MGLWHGPPLYLPRSVCERRCCEGQGAEVTRSRPSDAIGYALLFLAGGFWMALVLEASVGW